MSVARCNVVSASRFAFASQIHHREKQVADLFRDRSVVLAKSIASFVSASSSSTFAIDVATSLPIEIHVRRFLLHFLRAHQSRQSGANFVQIISPLLFLLIALDRVPLPNDCGRIAHRAVTENVRMPPDQFRRD